MTTVSSTHGSTYTAPPSTTSSNSASSSDTAYNGAAAVAQAQDEANKALVAQAESGVYTKLTDLPNTVIELLQGGTGNDLINTLFGASDSNPINNQLTTSLTQTALAAAAYKRSQVNVDTSPVSQLIARQNAALNASNSTDTPASGSASHTGTDTSA